MKGEVVIFEPYTVKKSISGIDAHLRNSIILQRELQCRLLINDIDYTKAQNEQFDCIIVSYSSFHFPFKKVNHIIDNNSNAKIIWITNEYNIGVPIKNAKYITIANYSNQVHKKNVTAFYEVNLNLLFARKPNSLCKKKYDICYYGTFRRDREKYFKQYMKDGMILSTSSKNIKQFISFGCMPRFIDRFSWTFGAETLNLFRYSLYIEDEYTHSNFNNLANRWYEAGFCNAVVFFDSNCKNTILKSEIGEFYDEIKYFIVSTHTELMEKIKQTNLHFENALNTQKRWRIHELSLRNNVIEKIKEIVYA